MSKCGTSLTVLAAMVLAAPQALAQANQPDTVAEPEVPSAERPAHIPPDANLRSDEPSDVVGTQQTEEPSSPADLGEITLTHDDQELLGQLAPNAVAGLQAANLATGKHLPEEVRIHSEHVAATQSELTDRISVIEEASGIDFPDTMSENAQAQINDMRALNEAEFSEAYLAFVRSNYTETVDLLREAQAGDYSQVVRDMAGDVLPELQAQLETAQEMTVAAVPEEGAQEAEGGPAGTETAPAPREAE